MELYVITIESNASVYKNSADAWGAWGNFIDRLKVDANTKIDIHIGCKSDNVAAVHYTRKYKNGETTRHYARLRSTTLK